MFNKTIVFAVIGSAFAFGCAQDPGDESQETIDNLVQAGFPADDIQIFDGKVVTGLDAVVSLQASREMLETGDTTQEQYSTTNKMGAGVTKVCVNPTSKFTRNAALMTGLNAAVANYNARGLTFTMAVGPTSGCSANISITTQGGSGSSAGFPSGGLPYPGPVYVGTGTATYGAGPVKHVIEHELGHCIGFRHTDYYNRSISCGGAASNEGTAGVGANLIPGTPSTAVLNGSVYNSCYNTGSNGTFTASDVTSLNYLY
jgi:Dual-action HEIGH metallo-peptidase